MSELDGRRAAAFVVHRQDGRDSHRTRPSRVAGWRCRPLEGSERPPVPWNNVRHAHSGKRSWKGTPVSHALTQRCQQAARAFLAQPTADSLHLGNFTRCAAPVGALAEDHEAFYKIADLLALTVATEPAVLRERTLRTAAQLLAAGIDPAKATVFLQSEVPEHTQLNWVLGASPVSARPSG